MRRTLSALAACIALPASAAMNPAWTEPVAPHVIYGNTYFVGTRGLSSILITSPQGHVLIDATLPENATLVEANIRKLGFRIEDIKLILNSHAHADHAGGIARLARDTGAPVRATAAAAKELALGGNDVDDPQHGEAPLYPAVKATGDIVEGSVVRVGSLTLTAHLTPGHTPGGTAWTWQSCEGAACKQIVFADSLGAFAADGYRFADHPAYVTAYRQAIQRLGALQPCDVLLAPHPEQAEGKTCATYADAGRRKLEERLAKETAH
ncbi:subclass B3 metallo-beta-lactamase [Luteibacter sp. 9133]|uniref:subclass B3 metallo-beta-lactamase n=1 Tax=Luteibacter sp. 9133 TaxID=1500891 RepID=UPI0005BA2D21|nr:subclass B3 metallo-beta-lactamase [Luteibacter sp. 9133]